MGRPWLHEPGWLALQKTRHLSKTQQKSSLRLYDNRASPVSWDPSIMMIPGGNFLGNHACWASRRMDQARNKTAGNTLFMRIASLRAAL